MSASGPLICSLFPFRHQSTQLLMGYLLNSQERIWLVHLESHVTLAQSAVGRGGLWSKLRLRLCFFPLHLTAGMLELGVCGEDGVCVIGTRAKMLLG